MKHGEWATDKVAFMKACSECGESVDFSHDYNYCPNCGAKMGLEKINSKLTVKELYDFLYEKGLADNAIDLMTPFCDDFDGSFSNNKDNILKTFGDCEVTGIDIYNKSLTERPD